MHLNKVSKINARMGWTVAAPSSAEGCLLIAGALVRGRTCASPTLPEGITFRVAISTAPDPQGPSRVDIPTHPFTTAACAAVVVAVTAGRDSSCSHCHGNPRIRPLGLDWIANSTHATADVCTMFFLRLLAC